MNPHEIMRQAVSVAAALAMSLASGYVFVVVPSHLEVERLAAGPATRVSGAKVVPPVATESGPREAAQAATTVERS